MNKNMSQEESKGGQAGARGSRSQGFATTSIGDIAHIVGHSDGRYHRPDNTLKPHIYKV